MKGMAASTPASCGDTLYAVYTKCGRKFAKEWKIRMYSV
jgi:hypothetical protein